MRIRRVADGGVRWIRKGLHGRPLAVLQGRQRAILCAQPAGFHRFTGLARLVLASGNAGEFERGLRIASRRSPETDFTEDLKKIDVPTLIIHGDDDQIGAGCQLGVAPGQAGPEGDAQIYKGASHGLFATHKDQMNEDLLAFIQS